MHGYRAIVLMLAISVSAALLPSGAARAETEMMILLDASGTMAAPGTPGTSHTKFDEVRTALNALLQSLPADVAVGLRLMGGSPAADCYTSYLYLAPTQGMRSQAQDYLAAVSAAGTRALYQGIEDSLNDLGAAPRTADLILLVITDAGDDCGRDFGELARTYSYVARMPRVVIYGLDLPAADKATLGEFAGETGGRVVDLDSMEELLNALQAFSEEFKSNLRIHLLDDSGNAVPGDVVIRNASSGAIVAERLDISDFSTNVGPGQYEITGRYLGQEVRSDLFTIAEGESRTVSLEFAVYLEPFTLTIRDLYDRPLRARVTFLNSANEPVLTTDVNTIHRVQLPPDNYSIEIRLGNQVYTEYGIPVGPAFDQFYELELPVELGTLEVEVVNGFGSPINAKVTVYDQDGTLLDEAPSTSYLYLQLPPGEYRLIAELEEKLAEQTVYLYSGDQMEVGLQIDVALGDLLVRLRTESGQDAWGWVRIYDSESNLIQRYDPERMESPDWYLTDLPVGIYRVEAEVEGVVRVMSGVEVKENEEAEIEIVFPEEVF